MPTTHPASLITVDQFVCPSPWQLLPRTGEFWAWRSCGSPATWIALGSAKSTTSLGLCREWLKQLPLRTLPFSPRCFGAVAFDDRAEMQDEWSGFAVRKFVLPRTLIRWISGTATAVHLGDPVALEPVPESRPAAPPRLASEQASFALPNWRRAVGAALAEFEQGELDKVVIAERVRLALSGVVELRDVLGVLGNVEDCALFACRDTASGIFLGASPERLFRMQGRELEVDSLAGTRPRGATVSDDDRLALELERSAKERREQACVTEFLRAQLADVCEQVHEDTAAAVRRLANVQHLQTRLRGVLRAEVTPDQLLRLLHPTPAVCGNPVAPAREWIRSHEPHARGLYAGAVGWIDVQDAEFMVAIRSGLLRDHHAYLYAGAGIVPGSRAEAEYAECGWKMAGMRSALGV
ncbi:isochorismate synthase [candidate division KSB1 bacterium]|nr:isochorismate synthase [candidate division KSB1 bacterium]